MELLRAFECTGSGEEGKHKHSQHKKREQSNEVYFQSSAERARYFSVRVQEVWRATQRQAGSVCTCLHEGSGETWRPLSRRMAPPTSAAARQADHGPSGGSCRGASAICKTFIGFAGSGLNPRSTVWPRPPHEVSRSADDDSCLLQAELARMDSAGTPA